MRSGFSDDGADGADGGERYGIPGFVTAVVTILVLEFSTAVGLLAWYFIPVTVVPAVVILTLIGWALTRGAGAVGQIGRGLLVGCLAAPLTLVILIPTYLAARAAGLV